MKNKIMRKIMTIQSAEKTLKFIKKSNPELIAIISRDLNKSLSCCKNLPFLINLNFPIEYCSDDYINLLSILLDEAGYEYKINKNAYEMGFISEIKNNRNTISVKILKLKFNRS